MLKRIDLRKNQDQTKDSLPRSEIPDSDLTNNVREIINEVRTRGDSAVLDFTAQFDAVKLENLRILPKTCQKISHNIDPEFQKALEVAATAIKGYHSNSPGDQRIVENQGLRVETVQRAVQRAGCYVPGGRASYPSTLLMTALVAKAAGVEFVTVCVPPDEDGLVAPSILAAALIAEVDVVHPVGGAQAIAAMAYGTESIDPVDVIVGPGNSYVACAKKEVAGIVGVPAAFTGPSEIVVLADASVPSDFVAIDLIVQAEHGPDGKSWLVTSDEGVAEAVDVAIEKIIATASRSDYITATLSSGGYCVLVRDTIQALDVVNSIAPEHLQLMISEPDSVMGSVQNAGAVFCGPWAPASLGDYIAGPSHVLPTAGTARFAGALTTKDFIRETHIITADRPALERLAPHVISLALSEGLDAHAESIKLRRNYD